MSIDSSKIICTGCDYESRELYQPILIRYQTTKGAVIEGGQARGWCYQCAGYSSIESMDIRHFYDSLFQVESERLDLRLRLHRLNRGILPTLKCLAEKRRLRSKIDFQERSIAGLVGLIGIAKKRDSNARCLRCWSSRTVPVTFDPQDHVAYNFEHECGGHLKMIYGDSQLRVNFRISTYVLSEEGELLAKE